MTIHASLPWVDAELRPYECGNHSRYELSAEDESCFDCPLPDCDESDPRCPFAYINSDRHERDIARRAKRLARLPKTGWTRWMRL